MNDYMVRGTAANAQLRVFAATTKETAERARLAHNTSPVMTAALGRLLTAGAMMGVMLKGEKDLLTLQIRGDGPGRGLTVTAESAKDKNGAEFGQGRFELWWSVSPMSGHRPLSISW